MYQALHIVRKDARRFLSEIVIVATAALFVALFQNHETEQVSPDVNLVMTFQVIFVLFAALLIANVIHEDRIPGDTQFWLTRPYHWKSLLGAKILFILLFVNFPVFVAQAAMVRHAGFPVTPLLAGCLWLQVVLFVFVELPVMCISMLTSNLKQFVVSFIAAVGTVFIYFVTHLTKEAPDQYVFPPFSVDWLGWTMAGSILIAAATLIGALQYRRRASTQSRIIAVFAWILAVTVALIITSWELEAQTHLSPELARSSGIQLESKPAHAEIALRTRIPNMVEVRLSNILVQGVPEGYRVDSDQVFANVQWTDGRSHASANGVIRGDSVQISVFLSRDLFDRERSQPASITLSAYLTMFGNRTTRSVSLNAEPSRVTDNMSCFVSGGAFDGTNDGRIVCFPVFRLEAKRPSRMALADSANTATFINGIIMRNSGEQLSQRVSYSPFPSELALDPLLNNRRLSMTVPGQQKPIGSEVRVTEEQVLAHFRRDTTFQIRLSDLPAVSPEK